MATLQHRQVQMSDVLWKIANSYYDHPNFETLLHLVESMLSAQRSRLGFGVADTDKIAFNAFMDTIPKFAVVLGESRLHEFGSMMMSKVAEFLDEKLAASKPEKQPVIRG